METISGNHLLAIAKVHEKYAALAELLQPLRDEMAVLKEIFCDGQNKMLKRKYILCGDLNFNNTVMGPSACSSKYSCVWCQCSTHERGYIKRMVYD